VSKEIGGHLAVKAEAGVQGASRIVPGQGKVAPAGGGVSRDHDFVVFRLHGNSNCLAVRPHVSNHFTTAAERGIEAAGREERSCFEDFQAGAKALLSLRSSLPNGDEGHILVPAACRGTT